MPAAPEQAAVEVEPMQVQHVVRRSLVQGQPTSRAKCVLIGTSDAASAPKTALSALRGASTFAQRAGLTSTVGATTTRLHLVLRTRRTTLRSLQVAKGTKRKRSNRWW